MSIYLRNSINSGVRVADFETAGGPPVLTVDSISVGPYTAGDTVTISHSNASATGKTLANTAGALALVTQDADNSTFVIQDPETHGDGSARYEQDITFTLTDGEESDTFTLSIDEPSGSTYVPITALTGFLANDVGISVNDPIIVEVLTGSFDAIDPATGAFATSTGGTFRYNVYSISGGAWEGEAIVTAEAPTSSVSNVFGLSWEIYESVKNSSQIAWNTLSSIVRDNQINWTVEAVDAVLSTYSLSWDMESATSEVERVFEMQWNLLNTISKSSDIQWNALELVAHSEEVSWTIESTTQSVAIELDVNWNVLEIIEAQNETQWSVLGQVSKSNLVNWSVQTNVVRKPMYVVKVLANT